MSFMLTQEQIRNRTKTVTRRLGWRFLKAGEQVQACVKCMGLKPGETIERICVIEILSVRLEILDTITQREVRREGFPHLNPSQFVEMFCREMSCSPETEVTRIHFAYY